MSQKTGDLSADGRAQGGGQRVAEALHVSFVFGFDHDARELLGAGIPQNDAAILAKRRIGFGEGAGNFRKRFERRFRTDLHVDNQLRIFFQPFDKRFDLSLHGNERSNLYSSEQAVSCRAVFEKNDVARLFAAKRAAAPQHFFEDVAIANGGSSQRYALAGQNTLQSQVGHGRRHNAVAFEFVLRFQETRGGKQHAIPVDDFPVFADKHRAVGVAIESHTKPRFFRHHALLQAFQVKRSARCVDVAAVGHNAHGDDVRAERAKQFGGKLVSSAIRTIQNYAEAAQLRPGNHALAEKLKIFRVERSIGSKVRRTYCHWIDEMLQNIGFQLLLNRVGKFHARMREELHAVVLKRIVRSGNDHAGLKIILPNETSDTGSGDHSGKRNLRA